MEKIKCPNCGLTLIFATMIDAEIKCNRCKQIDVYKRQLRYTLM